jgi:uroporphyrinogen-III decarboxylase
MYEEFLLPCDNYLADRLPPFGIHYCGAGMERVAAAFAKVHGCEFFDVGWGSDVARCRELLPDTWFNLRLSPVKLMTCTPDEVRADVESLLLKAGPLEKASVCCINLGHGTPDDNVRAIFDTVARYRRYGA